MFWVRGRGRATKKDLHELYKGNTLFSKRFPQRVTRIIKLAKLAKRTGCYYNTCDTDKKA